MSMKVQVLGTGCPRCKTLTANAEVAVQELGLDAEIVKVDQVVVSRPGGARRRP